MKIISVSSLEIPEIKIIKFDIFEDNRGFFTELFRSTDFQKIIPEFKIVQSNESYSKKGVIRGLHFQWNPFMGKLVRTIEGHMIDIILDIRIESPNYGKIIMFNMPSNENIWIWIPPGFAHGNLFLKDTKIEYFCTGEYSPRFEVSISILSNDINWSLCNKELYQEFLNIKDNLIISDKDKNGLTLKEWINDLRSNNFRYNKISNYSILVTGGSGLLGTKLKNILEADYPTSSEFNILDYTQMYNYISKNNFKTLIHCAAFTSPPNVEKNPIKGLDINIIGTCNIVKLCQEFNIKLIYISTDYVFDGEKGNYKENDQVLPINKYAWSKLGGECAVKMYDNHLIIRLSFGPDEFPYTKAFIDQYTSRLPVTKIVKQIIKVLDQKGIIHLGTNRRSVYEYAKSISDKNIEKISINDINNLKIPKDTSLNINLYKQLN